MIDSRRISATRSATRAAHFFSRHPVTLLVMTISLLCVAAMPQIARQFTTLPSPRLIFENVDRDAALGAALWLYLGLLVFLYVAVVFIVSADANVVHESRPSLVQRLGGAVRQRIRRKLNKLLYQPAARRSRRSRLVLGGVFVALGITLYVGLHYASALVPLAGPPIQTYWAVLLVLVGLWLVLGKFESGATGGESNERGGAASHWTSCTRTAGLILLVLLMNGILGELVWWLVTLPSTPLSWRVYTLWALIQIGLVAVGLALFADSVGRTAGQRLAVFAGLLFVLGLPKSTVPIGYDATDAGQTISLTRSRDQVRRGLRTDWDELTPQQRRALTGELTERWFAAVRNRLARMPRTEPVIFVAAAGGGSRAALYATVVLEALERTPPHGSLNDWTEVETERSLADQVLFISSVSGGSVASAHYVLNDTRDHPTITGEPRNTIFAQLRDTFSRELCRLCTVQWDRCSEEIAANIDDGRECAVYRRLCTPTDDGFQVMRFEPDAGESGERCEMIPEAMDATRGWPLGSRRFDDMATDFNAPLLRGVVMPGVERGEMVTQFWLSRFRWREAFERGEKDHGPGANGTRPLLLINVTGVEEGARYVAGFPRFPRGLLGELPAGGRARSITDIDARMAVDVEEAVRMSANFPWGFDLPIVGLGASRSRYRVIDGGVLDNSGIDTFTLLIDRLEHLSGDAAEGCNPFGRDIHCGAQWLLDELALRGVVLLEIDSGAKPGAPGRISEALANVLMPIHALSESSYARSVEASLFHSGKLETVLSRHGNHLLDEQWQTQTGEAIDRGENNDDIDLVGKRLAHVVYVLDTEKLMTAWALSPEEKAELLARFLAEDARQRLELRDQFEDIEGANVARDVLFPKALNDARLRTFLMNLSRSMDELIRLEREAIARDTARRRRNYDDEVLTPEVTSDRTAVESRRGWVFVGYHHPTRVELPVAEGPAGERTRCNTVLEPNRWAVNYLDFDVELEPERLEGQTFKTSVPLKLHRIPPAENGNLDRRPEPGALPEGTFLEIEELRQWHDYGFYFASVRVVNEPAS